MATETATIEKLADHVFTHLIKKSKHKIVSIDAVSPFLRDIVDNYSSELGIAVRNALLEHPKVQFFKEGDYVHEQKFYYCVGNWLTVKGVYDNPIQAKEKAGMLSWQKSEDDDGVWLD